MGRFSDVNIDESEDFTNYDREMGPETRTGTVVNAKYVNVRRKPNRTGEVLGQVTKGHLVTILDEAGDYLKIKYGNYPEAYVAAHFIEL